jgi:zeaxanthin glucosyltransferase
MQTALFIMMPTESHYFVAFGLAKSLQSKGFKIYFTYDGKSSHAEFLLNEGFLPIQLRYATEYKNMSFKLMFAFFIKSILDHNFTKIRYREFLNEVIDLQRLEKNISPSIIFIDSHFSHNVLFLWRCFNKIVVINTKLSTCKSPGIPPLTVGWIAHKGLINFLRAEIDWMSLFVRRKIKIFKESIAFTGYNNEYFLKKQIRNSAKKRVSQWLSYSNCFGRGVISSPKIITYPSCLEYSCKKRFSDEYYIEFSLGRDENNYYSNEYLNLIEELDNRRQGVQIVYCAIGTQTKINDIRGTQLLRNVISGLGYIDGIELVVATGGITLNLYALPPNVHIFSKLPQLHMLSHADLMINHGGLNSISECIQAQVPVLVYPFLKNYDHFGNAARVMENGFGLIGNPSQDTPTDIVKKVQHLLSNSSYKWPLEKRLKGSQDIKFDDFIASYFSHTDLAKSDKCIN